MGRKIEKVVYRQHKGKDLKIEMKWEYWVGSCTWWIEADRTEPWGTPRRYKKKRSC